MMRHAVTPVQRRVVTFLAMAFIGAAAIGWANQVWGLAILGSLLAAIFIYATWEAYQKPLRKLTPYERFELRRDGQINLALILGFVLFLALYYLTPLPLALLFAAMALWAGLVVYLVRRARWRGEGVSEGVEAYKKRVGYVEPKDPD